MSAALQFANPTSEFAFVPADHAAIAELVYKEAGILLPSGKAQLVYGRLAKRVRALKFEHFSDYVALLKQDDAERAAAIDALTTNHTSFFRESHHFEHFCAEVWPTLNERLNANGSVRLWSSACSSGEEPYTLAMSILGRDRAHGMRTARQDLRILATDLSHSILATARSGRYPADVAKSIPAELRALWMRKDGEISEIGPDVRSLISFRELNLLGDWPMRGLFDAIFCRNVMIYFDEITKEKLQTRLADRLAPGGFLYIGHSERLSPSVERAFRCVGRTIFQKEVG